MLKIVLAVTLKYRLSLHLLQKTNINRFVVVVFLYNWPKVQQTKGCLFPKRLGVFALLENISRRPLTSFKNGVQ